MASPKNNANTSAAIRVNGKAIRGDMALALLALKFLRKKDTLVYDLRISKAFAAFLRNKGIKPLPSPPQKKELFQLMKENKARLGAIMEGRIYSNKTAAPRPLSKRELERAAKQIAREEAKEAEKAFEKWHKSKPSLFKARGSTEILISLLKKKYRRGAVMIYRKGILVEFSNWWFNLTERGNGKKKELELIIEARQKKMLEQKIKELKKLISSHLKRPS